MTTENKTAMNLKFSFPLTRDQFTMTGKDGKSKYHSGAGCFNCINQSSMRTSFRGLGLSDMVWNLGYYFNVNSSKNIHPKAPAKITEFLSNSHYSDCFLSKSYEEICADKVVKLNIEMPRNAVFLSLLALRHLICLSVEFSSCGYHKDNWDKFSVQEILWLESSKIGDFLYAVQTGEAQCIRPFGFTKKVSDLFWRGKIQDMFPKSAPLKEDLGYTKYSLLDTAFGDLGTSTKRIPDTSLLQKAMKGVTSVKEDWLRGQFAKQLIKSKVGEGFIFRGAQFPENHFVLIMIMLLTKQGVELSDKNLPLLIANLYTGLVSGTVKDDFIVLSQKEEESSPEPVSQQAAEATAPN